MDGKEGKDSKFTINTLFSFQVLIVLAGVVMFVTRLSDKIDRFERYLGGAAKRRARIMLRIYKLEDKANIKHPHYEDDEGDQQ